MRKEIPFVVSVCVLCCVFSCKKESSPQALIIGKWKLQQSHFVNYENGTKLSDTSYSSNPAYATTFDQFNKDGSFTDVVVYSNGQKDTIWAHYSLLGTTLSFSDTKSYSSETLVLTPSAIFFLGAYNVKIATSLNVNQITADRLGVHSEITLTDDNNNINRTAVDQYYVR